MNANENDPMVREIDILERSPMDDNFDVQAGITRGIADSTGTALRMSENYEMASAD